MRYDVYYISSLQNYTSFYQLIINISSKHKFYSRYLVFFRKQSSMLSSISFQAYRLQIDCSFFSLRLISNIRVNQLSINKSFKSMILLLVKLRSHIFVYFLSIIITVLHRSTIKDHNNELPSSNLISRTKAGSSTRRDTSLNPNTISDLEKMFIGIFPLNLSLKS